jgi:hypothetical protein
MEGIHECLHSHVAIWFTSSSCLLRTNFHGPLRANELGKMFVDDRDRVLLKVSALLTYCAENWGFPPE